MTKELKTIDLNLLPIETLKEMAHDSAEQVEKNAKATVQKAIDCGRYLTAIKEQLEHGEWGAWLGENWNYSQPTANRYMTIAANYSSMNNLKQAKDINDALRMIADSKPETVPRSERKPANVKVTTPSEPDDDPTPDSPTQRKTAKGSEKIPEGKKPRTQQVSVELVDDEPSNDPWEYMTFGDIISVAVSKLADDQKKTAAKQLRKLADKLDPPTKFAKPDLEEVSAYMHTLGDGIGKDVATAADGFIDHYESNGWMVGKVAMKDWRATARKWLKNQGQFSNGKANGNGHGTTTNLGSNGRPPVPRSKINYK